jgi:hypothetical protein
MDEVLTRIWISEDLLLTAAVIRGDLTPDDRTDLNAARDLLLGILARHKEEEGS